MRQLWTHGKHLPQNRMMLERDSEFWTFLKKIGSAVATPGKSNSIQVVRGNSGTYVESGAGERTNLEPNRPQVAEGGRPQKVVQAKGRNWNRPRSHRSFRTIAAHYLAGLSGVALLCKATVVRPARLELARVLPHSDLNAARLPIPPRPHALTWCQAL